MKPQVKQIAAVLALTFASVSHLTAANIDNFTVPVTTQSVSDNTGVLQSNNVTGLGATTISGERTITAQRTGGTGTVEARVDQVSNTFNVDAGSGTQGIGTIEWDITGGQDLTADGATSIEYEITNNDQGATIQIEVEDQSTATSTFTSALIGPGVVGDFNASYNQFVGSADFTDISRIKITITNQSDTDFAMRAVITAQPQDFGDAPESGTSPNGSGTNSYCTTLANNGPRHIVNFDAGGSITGPLLGATSENVDSESDANTNGTATADDSAVNPANVVPNDETGVTASSLIAGGSSSINFEVTGATGKVNAWIDFNGDGDFEDAGEQIMTNESFAVGAHTKNFSTPTDAFIGTTFMRIRISTADLTGSDTFKSTGVAAADGEVEDHQVTITAFDWGDAIDSFKTVSASDGPVHPFVASDAKLGSLRDSESDGQPSTGASDDDTNGVDDEDGVTGIPTLITTVGASDATISVTITEQNADISAWVDLNQDGDFADAGEQFIGANTAQAVGTTNYTLPLASGAPYSTTATTGDKIYVRFRAVNSGDGIFEPDNSNFHASGGFIPITSGEVEDYVIQVVTALQDWGDAPDTYTTTAGPRHTIGTGDPQFGAERDAEAAGQPSVGADGDDTTGSPDDEDGVDFASVGTINIGSTISLPITVSGAAGNINAFIDFNGDGDFLDGGEQVLTNVAQAIGTTNHNILIPGGSTPGTTYARFRISTIGSDAADSGTAADGEIEDYVITLTENLDWGDAPESGTSGNGTGTNNYGTTVANNGPRHTITGPRLGASVDSENDGQPNSDATGDGADENGVTFAACLTAGIANNTPINVAGAAGKVSLWIDLNADGDFLDAGEQLLNNVPQGVSTLPYPLVIPADATAGPTFARVRVVASSDPNVTSPHGAADSGEVEDYAVTICKDYGDAPDSYCTVLASDGARHAQSGPFLGTNRDVEADAAAVAPGADATGDDTTGSPDDEDGVSFSNSGIFDTTSSSNQITFTIGSGPADVEVYVDWNRDGDFEDAGEKYDFDNHAGGTESLAVGTLSTDGVTYVRVRVYNVGEALDSPKGEASSGEVEDYRITLSTPTLVDLLAFDAAATEDGQVALNWTTGAEIDTAGFNLIRRQLGEDSAASYEPVKLNSQLIPSQGTSVEGASYEYMDTPGYGTFFYQLEDIEISGKAGLHPFREVTVLPTLNIGLDDDSNVNLNYVVLPGWDYEVEYKSLADVDADWQALPDAPHNDGAVSDEVGSEAADRLYRLKASPRE